MKPAGVSLNSSNKELNAKYFLLMCAYFAQLRRTCLTVRRVLQHIGRNSPLNKDSFTNMTCLPLSLAPVSYMCACDSEKGELITGIKWNDDWEKVTESGSVMKRSVCNTQADWCIDGMFKKNLLYSRFFCTMSGLC